MDINLYYRNIKEFELRFKDSIVDANEFNEILQRLNRSHLKSRRLSASLIRGILSFKQSVFIISSSVATELFKTDPANSSFRTSSPYGWHHEIAPKMWTTVRTELEAVGIWRVVYVRPGSPAIVQVVNPVILGLIGNSTDEWTNCLFENLSTKNVKINRSILVEVGRCE